MLGKSAWDVFPDFWDTFDKVSSHFWADSPLNLSLTSLGYPSVGTIPVAGYPQIQRLLSVEHSLAPDERVPA